MELASFDFRPVIHSAKLVEERLRIRLKTIGLPVAQARVLNTLDILGAASQAELAKAFDLSPSSMSTMTGRLLKAGLVDRRVDPHELRNNIITLTDRGRGLLEAIHEQWRATDDDIAELIGTDKARQIGQLALELRNAFGKRSLATELAEGRKGKSPDHRD